MMNDTQLLKAIEENKWDVVCVNFYQQWAVGHDIDLTLDEEDRTFVVADTLKEAIKKAIENDK